MIMNILLKDGEPDQGFEQPLRWRCGSTDQEYRGVCYRLEAEPAGHIAAAAQRGTALTAKDWH
jgi:hypothetical protein